MSAQSEGGSVACRRGSTHAENSRLGRFPPAAEEAAEHAEEPHDAWSRHAAPDPVPRGGAVGASAAGALAMATKMERALLLFWGT